MLHFLSNLHWVGDAMSCSEDVGVGEHASSTKVSEIITVQAYLVGELARASFTATIYSAIGE